MIAMTNTTAYNTIVSTIVGVSLATTGVALRLAARWLGAIKLKLDDYLMLLALVSRLQPPCSFLLLLTSRSCLTGV